MDTTINKEQLLQKLKDNRETHINDFAETQEGFFTKVQKDTEEFLAQVKLDPTKVKRWGLSWTKPRSYEEDYDRAIGMVEAHVGQELTLTENDFRQYWQDIWGWTHEYVTTSSYYNGKFAPPSN